MGSNMTVSAILVIGGYGGTGQRICHRLLQETGARVAVGGRNLKRAENLRDRLNGEYGQGRASAVCVDASDRQSLIAAYQGVTLVIDASIAVAHVHTVASAAIEAGIDYLDIHFEQKTVPVLEALAPWIKASGRCFISQAGFHPGLPAAFIRHAASDFDVYDTAVIGMAMNQKIEKFESVYEIVDMLNDYKVDIFKDGAWKFAGPFDTKQIDFGARFGPRTCYPLQMAEISEMPQMFGLKETGVYVAGFNWFVDQLVFPLGMLLFKIRPGLGRNTIAKLLLWGMKTFSRGRQGVCFVFEATGAKDGKQVSTRLLAEHDDAYEFTAIPVVACVQQYLDGAIVAPGLWMMGQAVDPGRLLSDMERMGILLHRS
jgi:saccharopine dehydrogenase-like NADP-dependent oxidoreductase